MIGLLGTVIGLALGCALIAYLDAYSFPIDPKVYLIDHLPVRGGAAGTPWCYGSPHLGLARACFRRVGCVMPRVCPNQTPIECVRWAIVLAAVFSGGCPDSRRPLDLGVGDAAVDAGLDGFLPAVDVGDAAVDAGDASLADAASELRPCAYRAYFNGEWNYIYSSRDCPDEPPTVGAACSPRYTSCYYCDEPDGVSELDVGLSAEGFVCGPSEWQYSFAMFHVH